MTDPSFNGGAVVSVTSATSFSYSQTGPNATWTAAPGGVSEAVVMFYGNNNAAGAIQEITSSEKVFVNSHTLTR